MTTADDTATPLLSPDDTNDNAETTNNDAEAAEPNERLDQTNIHPPTSLSALALSMIIFFNVTGGTFGIEPVVKAAGNFYAILGIALMPFFWSLPEMFMTYKMSIKYPCASGGVLWCENAFGTTTGLLQGYLGWVGGVVNAATFPAVLYEYIMSQFYPDKGASEIHPFIRYGFMLLLVFLMTLINYRGMDCVGKASISIYVMSMSAFLVMTIIGIPQVDPHRWKQTPQPDTTEQFDDDSLATTGWMPVDSLNGIDFRVLVNTLYWNFNNFDQAGHYSVSVPKKIFKRGMIAALFLSSSAYLIPILIATGATDIPQSDWKVGTFAVAGSQIAGEWLGSWIVVSAAICTVAAYCSEINADSMQLMGMSDRAQIPSIFSHRSSYGTPTYSILTCVIVVMSVMPLSFGLIVELTNFSYCLSVTLEFMAFVKLQVIDGDHSKTRRTLYFLLVFPAFVVNVLIILLASYATYIYASLVLLICFLLVNMKSICSFAKRYRKSRGAENNSVSSGLSKSVA